jgi:SAM-dependent methyltransferase
MITASKSAAAAADPAISKACTFEGTCVNPPFLFIRKEKKKQQREKYPSPILTTSSVLDATQLIHKPELQRSSFDKVFSNAAMHWILRPADTRLDFFRGVRNALKPAGLFCFEMGGMGNVAEIRAALLSVVSRRVGMARARAADPWFFPDGAWMRRMLEQTVGGFKVERMEREYRPTPVDQGGVEGWVRLMGKQFLDAVPGSEDREACVAEVCEVLQSVCESPGGGEWLGYVRLRAVARRI